ncbi:MAG TPA: glycosyltransferase family 4 protein [Ktedonobacterales bacterium]
MRIAQVAPLFVATPPRGYGGTERIISGLTEALVQQGHDVTLFATGDSRTSARLVACAPEALGFEHLFESGASHVAMMAQVYRRASEFDVIHSHMDYHALPFAAHSKTPTIITLHGALDVPGYPEALSAFRDTRYVSISDNQRTPAPNLNWAATVYHGIDVQAHPFGEQPGTYLLFVGRISPEKGPERAIAIARRCGIPLKIAAKVDPKDRKFFAQTIKPLLDDPLIEFLGPVNEQRKCELMKNALALLLPIRWPEPFGLVFIESLACGTPVLTCPMGAAPEILREGETGFMRESDDGLAEAALRVRDVSRAGCRAWAERRFDISEMTRNYVEVYQAALGKRQRQRALDIPMDVHVDTAIASTLAHSTEQAMSQ